MNKTLRSHFSRLGINAGMALACLTLAQRASALDVIDPSGFVYTNAVASSTFSGGFSVTNLFSMDMSGISVGQTFAGSEYAKSGAGDSWVAFSVDQSYIVGSVYWAQRNGASTGDNMQLMSIWTSDTTPFPTSNPGTAAVTVVPLQANIGASVWREYPLTNVISGKYFLLHLEQTPGNVTGNPGGNEFRLGLNSPVAPSVVQQPESKTIYSNASVYFKASTSGGVPQTFQWFKDGVALSDGARISGSKSTKLIINHVTSADLGNYTLGATNMWGSTLSDPATISLIAAPANAYSAAVLSSSPISYLRLGETGGSSAFDYAGGYNGAFGAATGLGADGPQSPAYPGFEADNLGIQTTQFVIDSAATIPPFDITTTNRFTITAWVKPSGPQNPYAGLVFSRSAGTISGLSYDSTGTKLAYEWAANRVNFDSKLLLPDGQWSFIALTVSPTNAVLYCGTNASIRMATDTLSQPPQTWGGDTKLGLDVSAGEASRTFNGNIDEVAFYAATLSESQITALFQAAVGTIAALPVEITSDVVDASLYTGETLKLSITASGTAPIAYQWYKDSALIGAATNASYVVGGVTTANAGNYYVVASNSANSITSRVASVTVSSNVLRVLDGTGALYTGVAASSVFGNSISWGPTNLFKTDVSNLAIGSVMLTEGGGKEWARQGGGDAWVTFQVDQAYPIGAVYWSQRVGSGTGDNMQIMSLWSSTTTPFSAADPGTDPENVIPLTPNSGNPIWTRYILTNQVTGQYFLAHLQQTTVTGNPGGSEMRLAVIGVPQPLGITRSNSMLVITWPAYGVLQKASNVAGPYTTATGITNGVPFAPGSGSALFRVKYY